MRGRLMVGFGRVAESLLGYSPWRAFGVGPVDEPKGVLTQWFRWNRTRRWMGSDGFDYLAALADLAVRGRPA